MRTFIVAAVILCGCGGKVEPTKTPVATKPEKLVPVNKATPENYLKIQKGMQIDEVKIILGEPNKVSRLFEGTEYEFVSYLEWKGDKGEVFRVFLQGTEGRKVSRKESSGL